MKKHLLTTALLFAGMAAMAQKPKQLPDTLIVLHIKDYRLIMQSIQALQNKPTDAIKLRVNIEINSLQNRVQFVVDSAEKKGKKP